MDTEKLPPRDHNGPPAPIVPEKLVDTEALPQLLTDNFKPLADRGKALEADIAAWVKAHTEQPPENWPEGKPYPVKLVIRDGIDNGRTSDLMKLLSVYAGGKAPDSGEVNDARKKVKQTPFDACRIIDGHFNGLRDGIRQSAAIIDAAQTTFLVAQADEARRERQRLADLATANAVALAVAARAAAPAVQDEVIEQAIAAEEVAIVAQAQADVRPTDMVRSTSIGGVTTGLKETWSVQIDGEEGMMNLLKAVVAGKASIDYVMLNTTMLTTLVKQQKGAFKVPGLKVVVTRSAARRG